MKNINTANKAVSSKEVESKPVEYKTDSELHITVCLDNFISGLSLNIGVLHMDNYKSGYLAPMMNGEPIASFCMDWKDYLDPEDGVIYVDSSIISSGDHGEYIEEKLEKYRKRKNG